jgi:hypothetical protein
LPTYDDRAAITLMVELLATGFSTSLREVAQEAAKRLRLPGKLLTHEERLRKKYCRQREAGLLPMFQGGTDRLVSETQEAFASRAAAIAERQEQLAAAEQEALLLGLNLDVEEDLSVFLKTLEQEMEGLATYRRDRGMVVQLMLDQYRTPAEAKARLLADEERFNELQKQVAVVRTVRELRIYFSEVRRLLPQEVRSAGEELQKTGEEFKITGENTSNLEEE